MPAQFRLSIAAARQIGRSDYAAAAESYRAIFDMDPSDWGALLMLAYCHECRGQHSDALSAAMRALSLDQTSYLALRAVAHACINTGDHHSGKLYVEQALQRTPPRSRSLVDRIPFLIGTIVINTMRLLPHYRRRIPASTVSDFDADRGIRQCNYWAHSYLAWYEATYTGGGPSSVN